MPPFPVLHAADVISHAADVIFHAADGIFHAADVISAGESSTRNRVGFVKASVRTFPPVYSVIRTTAGSARSMPSFCRGEVRSCSTAAASRMVPAG